MRKLILGISLALAVVAGAGVVEAGFSARPVFIARPVVRPVVRPMVRPPSPGAPQAGRVGERWPVPGRPGMVYVPIGQGQREDEETSSCECSAAGGGRKAWSGLALLFRPRS